MSFSSQKIALFIDGNALYRAAAALEFNIDWKELKAHFSRRAFCCHANYYSLQWVAPNEEDAEDVDFVPIRPLLDFLEYNGFRVKKKEGARTRKDFISGKPIFEGSFAVDLAVDMCACLSHIDHYVLFIGDAEYKRAIQYVQQRGKMVTVVNTIVRNGFIADTLRRQADHFVELNDVKQHFSRK